MYKEALQKVRKLAKSYDNYLEKVAHEYSVINPETLDLNEEELLAMRDELGRAYGEYSDDYDALGDRKSDIAKILGGGFGASYGAIQGGNLAGLDLRGASSKIPPKILLGMALGGTLGGALGYGAGYLGDVAIDHHRYPDLEEKIKRAMALEDELYNRITDDISALKRERPDLDKKTIKEKLRRAEEISWPEGAY